MLGEAKMSEEKAQRAMIDAARLAEELRAEQEWLINELNNFQKSIIRTFLIHSCLKYVYYY